MGYILYKTELLNDIIQKLIPDFDIKNVSDECLEVYNNYIGSYDKYLNELNKLDIDINTINNIKGKSFLEYYAINKNKIVKKYVSIYNQCQHPYSSSSLNKNNKQKCLHDYLILNKEEDEKLNKTLDTILKLESIKNQK